MVFDTVMQARYGHSGRSTLGMHMECCSCWMVLVVKPPYRHPARPWQKCCHSWRGVPVLCWPPTLTFRAALLKHRWACLLLCPKPYSTAFYLMVKVDIEGRKISHPLNCRGLLQKGQYEHPRKAYFTIEENIVQVQSQINRWLGFVS